MHPLLCDFSPPPSSSSCASHFGQRAHRLALSAKRYSLFFAPAPSRGRKTLDMTALPIKFFICFLTVPILIFLHFVFTISPFEKGGLRGISHLSLKQTFYAHPLLYTGQLFQNMMRYILHPGSSFSRSRKSAPFLYMFPYL
jgi:hypothetical protein